MFSEEELLERCARGEDRAWEELHKRYAGYVRRMVSWRKWGFSPSDVEEIVQEVFTDLIKGISQFRGQSTLATFVSRVTQNNCVSALRRAFAQKRGKEVAKVSLDEPDEEGKAFHIPQALDPPPEEVLLRREEAAELHRALGKLSPECREIITLRYFHGLSYEEITAKLQLNLGTVCSRLKRCLTKLKDLYETGEGQSQVTQGCRAFGAKS